jgi:hypothetical protein
MAFEKFTKTGGRIGTPKVSIWSRGQIGLNQGAVHRYQLSSFNFVVLYYDKDANMIGMKFTNNDTDEGATKITKRKNSGISFSSSAFLNYYGIDYNKTTKYDLEYDKENDLYVFNLEGKVI